MDDIAWKAELITLLYLRLNFCNISSAKAEHFVPLHFLRTLQFRNNKIPLLPSGMCLTLSNIKEIDLGHNLISHLHSDIFGGARKLHLLKLDSNKLTFVAPCTFGELESLRVLHMSNHYLASIGNNVFCNNLKSSLEELYINENQIVFIHGAIIASHMRSLMHLNTPPLQICCYVPMVQHCFPEDKFYLSTCRNLLGLAFRYGWVGESGL